VENTAKAEPRTVLQDEEGALYVSSNPDVGPVTRFGLGVVAGQFNYIGATRTAATGAKTIVYDPEQIVKLPAAEVARFRAEYQRAIASKALIARTFEDYAKQAAAETAELEREAKEAAAKAPRA